MGSNKKTNPRRKPATYADVEKGEERGIAAGIRYTQAIVFTVMLDKFGWDKEQLMVLWKEVDKLCDSVKEGRVTLSDLLRVLRMEYGLNI